MIFLSEFYVFFFYVKGDNGDVVKDFYLLFIFFKTIEGYDN